MSPTPQQPYEGFRPPMPQQGLPQDYSLQGGPVTAHYNPVQTPGLSQSYQANAFQPLRLHQGWGEAARRYIVGDKVAQTALSSVVLRTGRTARGLALKGTPFAEVFFAVFPGFVDDIVNLGIWTAAARGVYAQRKRMQAERSGR